MHRLSRKEVDRVFTRIEEARKDPAFRRALDEFIAITSGKRPRHRTAG